MWKGMSLTIALTLSAAGVALLMPACESVPLTAAPGTELTMIANPTFVIANGGLSVVTAIRSAGGDVRAGRHGGLLLHRPRAG
jgi:hypothetical protein